MKESYKELEIEHQRILIAEELIKKEADKLAEQCSIRSRWDDQHIQVQYMITGAMLDFSDIENKLLNERIAELELQIQVLTNLLHQ